MNIITDTLARIQNSVIVKKKSVDVLNAKSVLAILDVLKKEKMIGDFQITEDKKYVTVDLLYVAKEAVASHFEAVSKPGQRIYVKSYDIVPIMNGRGISIISTSKGVMCGAIAKSKNLGGEFICKVW